MKSGSNLLNKGYEPHLVEQNRYAYWEKESLFAARDESPGNHIPAPECHRCTRPRAEQHHAGHSVPLPRLRGDNVLWMPGTDHAGIATQNRRAQPGPGRQRTATSWDVKSLLKPYGSGAQSTHNHQPVEAPGRLM